MSMRLGTVISSEPQNGLQAIARPTTWHGSAGTEDLNGTGFRASSGLHRPLAACPVWFDLLIVHLASKHCSSLDAIGW